jgi:hypothetical protein
MRVPALRGTRLFTAALITAVPLSMGSLAPIVMHSVNTSDQVVPVAQTIAPRTTIASDLALTTKAERERKIAVSSAKGSRVWTASALADHDLPSAALRAYRHAARTVEATSGCSIPWTLLAGIGRVESDHGRYGGSVLGNDGVPRPAIIGVALNGAGAVAAIRDTDNGRFDGDRTWDRAVGPMQFIPSTWRTAGRDGDGDGVKSPNDIDDAALAAAAYLCRTSGRLDDASAERSAIFSYNASDYYVDLVMAFARGYRTGVFEIPSPPVAPVDHSAAQAKAAKAKAAAGKAAAEARTAAKARSAAKARANAKATLAEARQARQRAAQAAKEKAAKKVVHKSAPAPRASTPSPRPAPKPVPKPKPAPKPAPKPSPKPKPTAPALLTAKGTVQKVVGGWKIGAVKLTLADLRPIGRQDYDKNGTVGSVAQELDGLATAGAGAVVTYYVSPSFKVNGFSAL